MMTASAASATSTASPATAANLSTLSPQERQRAFALRFRTEMCRTYVATGRCDYRDRCMFAHGDAEMRTEAMNNADNLVDDKAIRTWIRDRRRAARKARQQAKHAAAAAAANATTSADDQTTPCDDDNSGCDDGAFLPVLRDEKSATSFASSSSADEAATAAQEQEASLLAPRGKVVSVYRYNPYSMYRPKSVIGTASC